ncbi:MAG: NAD-dependent epimerase/dehydratase family protein [Pseudomonadota bacterium]|nr:NAD-dependent epimerase/dehydratase family protein [Pseudomonadota bacterium]MEC9078050.1 NAD-dependent epimerase/dehydratase family protein [Pseudomonadota bacterium]
MYSSQARQDYVQSNLVGFLHITEGCSNSDVKHLVYASSSSVYGNNAKQPLGSRYRVDHPISLHRAFKRSNELMAHSYSYLFELACLGLRYFTVYGPWGRPDMAPTLFAKAILAG